MNAVITIHKSELMYDMQTETHIRAKNAVAAGVAPASAWLIQADDESDTAKALRSAQTAIEDVSSRLALFTSSAATIANNILMDDKNDAMTITLDVSTRFNAAMLPTITAMVHKYIVSKMLSDWFSTIDANVVAIYRARCEEALVVLQTSFAKKAPTKPVH